jgi:hypothetical protein
MPGRDDQNRGVVTVVEWDDSAELGKRVAEDANPIGAVIQLETDPEIMHRRRAEITLCYSTRNWYRVKDFDLHGLQLRSDG